MKLRAFEMIQYSKVFFLDADILIRRPLDEVFDLEAPAGVLYPNHSASRRDDGKKIPRKSLVKQRLNAGAWLLEPSRETFAQVCEKAARAWAWPHDIPASCCPEEELLTRYFASIPTSLYSLGIRWNLELWRRRQVTPDDIESAKLFHFSCQRHKPWWSAWRKKRNVRKEMSSWLKQRKEPRPHKFLITATEQWASGFKKCHQWVLENKHIDILAIASQVWKYIGGLNPVVRCRPWPCASSGCCTYSMESHKKCHSHHGLYEGSGEHIGVFYCEPCWERWLSVWDGARIAKEVLP